MRKISRHIYLSPETNEIVWEDGGVLIHIPIENQLVRILDLLLSSEGKLVPKEKFVEEIWGGNWFSGEKALVRSIFKLREFVKENQLETWLTIETIPKRGYRLVLPENSINNANQSRTRAWIKGVVAGAVFFAICTGVFVYIFKLTREKEPVPLKIFYTDSDTIIQLGTDNPQIIDLNDATVQQLRADTVLSVSPAEANR